MSEYNRRIIGKQAAELDFIRDTFEKVCRLCELLAFFEGDAVLSRYLALKGGTAINLTIFNMPRLSVDIDLDFSENLTYTEMDGIRKSIAETIGRYMNANSYIMDAAKSKKYHTLDSFVYYYTNAGGVKDNIKVEINYSLRSHVLSLVRRPIETFGVFAPATILSVDPIEIFAAKTVALLTRAAARDLYDMNNAVYYELFDEIQAVILRKCVVFYAAVASNTPPSFDCDRINSITAYKIRTDLTPVIRKKERFDLAAAQGQVKKYLSSLLTLTKNEREFLSAFKNKEYHPELLFEDEQLERVKNHPMALWKMQNHDRGR